ncbi:MAG TPA: 1-(5-phosphoribosyl)-5-[(5-phosphoribosylamino)methylideneamino] imidazole-4-carboxamide isomerase [Bacteroidota bacterium]|nr:1-(5-phosphoribosyl)-5-[(5-phosphoribosylamino)methylideneamino] imidazole-4-carboxamide isomerase [Bacteroidota bacterium]
MLLIFPAIEISKACCLEIVRGEPGAEHLYSVDPVQMAIIWRGENAKTLHVIDVDGVEQGVVPNRDIIKRMVEAVDIPIQVGGGLRDYETVKDLFSVGVYRVVLGTAAVENPGLVERLIKEFGARKVAIYIESKQGSVWIKGGREKTDLTPINLALQMRKIGVCRFVYSEIEPEGHEKWLNYDSLRELATTTGIRVTAEGGVKSYQDLIRLQDLEKFGVDSAIVGKPLYENRFACQQLWRINEAQLTDLGPTRRR